MSDQPLPPSHMDYRPQPEPPPPGWPPRTQRRAGLLGGSLLSLIVWPLTWKFGQQGNTIMAVIIAMVAVKVVTAIVCTASPRWRPLGAGLLASMGVGFLIFFGTCAMTFMHGV
jgi:hypothetical protein